MDYISVMERPACVLELSFQLYQQKVSYMECILHRMISAITDRLNRTETVESIKGSTYLSSQAQGIRAQPQGGIFLPNMTHQSTGYC